MFNPQTYYELMNFVRKAELVNRLLAAYPNFTATQILSIVNSEFGISPKLWEVPSKDLEIKLVTTILEFAEVVTKKTKIVDNSYLGKDSYIESGKWIIGSGLFGKQEHKEYYKDGVTSESNFNTEPDFNLYDLQVVVIKRFEYKGYMVEYPSETTTWHIYIYLPHAVINLEPEIESTIEAYLLE